MEREIVKATKRLLTEALINERTPEAKVKSGITIIDFKLLVVALETNSTENIDCISIHVKDKNTLKIIKTVTIPNATTENIELRNLIYKVAKLYKNQVDEEVKKIFLTIKKINKHNKRLFKNYYCCKENFDEWLWVKIRDNIVIPNNARILELLKQIEIKVEDAELMIKYIEKLEKTDSTKLIEGDNELYSSFFDNIDNFIKNYVGDDK